MNTTTTVRALAPPSVALRARDVADLTITSGHPCIPVLLPTEPPAYLHRLGTRAPGLLLVEGSDICPGMPKQLPGPDAAASSKRQHAAGQLHDLVDDLMEQVIGRGGQLALVRDGELTAHERIALIHRRGRDGRPAN